MANNGIIGGFLTNKPHFLQQTLHPLTDAYICMGPILVEVLAIRLDMQVL
jgi:hypothetical protein